MTVSFPFRSSRRDRKIERTQPRLTSRRLFPTKRLPSAGQAARRARGRPARSVRGRNGTCFMEILSGWIKPASCGDEKTGKADASRPLRPPINGGYAGSGPHPCTLLIEDTLMFGGTLLTAGLEAGV